LQLIDTLGFGGAERLLVDLAPRVRAQGVELCVASLGATAPLAEELRAASIPVEVLGFQGSIYSIEELAGVASRLRQLIRSFEPSILHSHLYLADVVGRMVAPRHVRCVTTLHNVDHWWRERSRVRSRAKTLLDRWTAALRGTRAIAVSHAVATEAARALRIPARRCRVVSNGVDCARFHPVTRALDGSPVIVQVGRLYPQKGHETALRAFSRLLDGRSACRLLLIGEGPSEPRIRTLAAELGISTHVELLGRRKDVPDLLRSAHVFWMPSEWEGMPVACLEAMATGIPIVVSDAPALRELVVGGTGIVVPRGDAVALSGATSALLSDYSGAIEMGQRAVQLVRDHYAIDATARAYAESYKDLMAGIW
jgi:glycosyltransferase involved in cell wall biosynthesis